MAVLKAWTYPDGSASKFCFWGWSECLDIFGLGPVSSENVAPKTLAISPATLKTLQARFQARQAKKQHAQTQHQLRHENKILRLGLSG